MISSTFACHSRRLRALRRASLVLGAASLVLASCARVEQGAVSEDPPQVIPDADAGSSGDAGSEPMEGGCDGSDAGCPARAVTCDEADWCPVPTGVSSLFALTTVWGSSTNDVWAGGSGGTLIHWDGASWKPVQLPGKNTIRVVIGNGPNDVWAASATDTMFHLDATAEWTRAPELDVIGVAPIFAAWADGTGAVRFGGRSYLLRDWSNGNQVIGTAMPGGDIRWAPEGDSATVHGIWGASPDEIWLVGDNRRSVPWQLGWTVRGVRDGGAFEWTELDSQSGVTLDAVWGSSASDVWAVGDNGTVRRFTAGADRWAIVESGTSAPLHAVWGSGPNDVWAVGDHGTILRWDGQRWEKSVAAFAADKPTPHLYGIWGSGPKDVWIVGDGVALHFTGEKK